MTDSLLTRSRNRSWVAWEIMRATSGETPSNPCFLAEKQCYGDVYIKMATNFNFTTKWNKSTTPSLPCYQHQKVINWIKMIRTMKQASKQADRWKKRKKKDSNMLSPPPSHSISTEIKWRLQSTAGCYMGSAWPSLQNYRGLLWDFRRSNIHMLQN